ncbi:MAG: ATP synthase subunit I [Planctomycetes bacterium]|nr:ATP synthase subunit I [Actinomycetota bacterium]MBM4022896.1 ATP synthase subunit I [Planctomycetota bacterium]
MGDAFLTRLDGPAPEAAVARDIARRAVPAAPAFVLLGLAMGGVDGGISALYALAIVVGNLVLAAALMAGAARISVALLMGAALFGFLLRLGLVFVAVMAVRDASWMHLPSLGITLIVAHLGLLFWEMRYVSLSLAHPGLKPGRRSTTVPSRQHEESIVR